MRSTKSYFGPPVARLRRPSSGRGILNGSCRGLGATYANGWLIMVGASRTSPVPGSGMRHRHERRRTLPRFGALLGDNTPSPALRGLQMMTKALVSTMVLLELYARGRRRQGLLSSPPRCESNSNRLEPLCMGALGGLYRPTPQGYNGNQASCWGPSVSVSSLRPLRRLLGPAA